MTSKFVADDESNVVEAIRHLHKNVTHNILDFTFISKDDQQTFRVHKLIAAIHSPVLRNVIYEDLCNSIEIKDVDILAIQNVVRYFYDEDIVIENTLDITETKKLADEYQIFELSRICKRKLADVATDISNVISVFELSVEFEQCEKEKECLLLINENKERVLMTQAFFSAKFEVVLLLLKKLKTNAFISEVEFLNSGIRWLETNKNKDKKVTFMEEIEICEIPMNEFLDIIVSFPEFFSNVEISNAISKIKNNQDTEIHETEEKEVLLTRSFGTNTDVEDPYAKKVKLLTIHTLPNDSVSNLMQWPERGRITLQYENFTRSLQFRICDTMKKGIVGSVADKQSYCDVDISYEGIYYMLASIPKFQEELHPVQKIEVLKAALHFKLKEMAAEYIKNIRNIVDYDPVFLDGLRSFPCFKDRFSHLLMAEPMKVMVHPNFINCSAGLLLDLLNRDELKVGGEIQLLLVVIMWLESKKPFQGHFRYTLLNNLAFELINLNDFEYALHFYPNFFTDKEKESILSFKKAETSEKDYNSLPDWYSSKNRKILPI